MKTVKATLVAACILLGVFQSFSMAQSSADSIRIIDVKLEKISLPNEAGRSPAVAKELGEDWYMAEVHFSTPLSKGSSADSIIEELQVKFYVDGLDSLKSDTFVVLTGEQTYLNVPNGEHYATMYLDPMSLIRYGGKKEQARGFKKSNFHAEILVAGKVEAQKSKNERTEKDDPNWFTQGQQLPGILIGLRESPWWPFEAKRYNRIKVKN